MRTAGIIAEYNPFHTGHQYHIEQTKKQAGADYAVVVMSPDYVQRGEPALFDKYARTKMALLCGADLVLELPVCYATASAERFARGAVSLLAGTGVVDVLSFGCDSTGAAQTERSESPAPGDRELFWIAARALARESEAFQRQLRGFLGQGIRFPAARVKALCACLAALEEESCMLTPLSQIMGDFLSTPNNILGVEYCKALLLSQAEMDILPIRRAGGGYHDRGLSGEHCSATALRGALRGGAGSKELRRYIPQAAWPLFEELIGQAVVPDDFLPCLVQQLLSRERFDGILDVSAELSERLRRLRFACVGRTYEEITRLLCSRHLTQARIRRALLHLLLGIEEEETRQLFAEGPVFYLNILGFRRDARPLLHEIKRRGTLPLLAKNADAFRLLGADESRMLRQDFAASHLYRSIRSVKYGAPFLSEYEISPVIL